ncbi:ABC transporter family substrate-binding protein [Streptomyces sp. NPDC007088]|uniref:ABC transporter family substrate-binding protein n=1 Tax=Streptomyces sp. NPDC007088 TaxID=3364773 RepID=UPI0036B5FB6E
MTGTRVARSALTARRTAVTAAALCSALVLAGCGGPDDGDAKAPRKAAPLPAGAQEVNPRPVAELRQGGTVKFGIQTWIHQYNAYQVDGTNGDAMAILEQVEPLLMPRDAKGVPHPDPHYLLSAKITSTGPQVVTYKLNPKARWSDGKRLSWRDFAALTKALDGSDDRYLVADSSGYDQIAKVERGADDQEARVTFKAAYADWPRLFRTLLPASQIDTPEKFNKGWIERIPVTSAAWKVGNIDKTAQTVTTVPDPEWWGDKPRLSRITWRALQTSALTEAYLNKEIDDAPAILPEDYKRLAKAPGTDIRDGARWDEVHITLGGRGPLKDLKVRQAVDLGIDRKGIITAFAKDLEAPVKPLDNHFFMPNQAGYRSNSGKWGKFDPQGAAKLLDEAGWKDNGPDSPRTKGGKKLQLTYVLSAGSSSSSLDQAQIVQQQLGQIGFKVSLQKVPDADYFEKYVDRGNFDLVSFRNVDQIFPSQLFSTFQRPRGKQSYLNFGGIGTAGIDELMTRAGHATDPAEARSLYNQADARIWAQGHSIELYQRPQIRAVRAKLANYGASGLGDIDYVKIGWEK